MKKILITAIAIMAVPAFAHLSPTIVIDGKERIDATTLEGLSAGDIINEATNAVGPHLLPVDSPGRWATNSLGVLTNTPTKELHVNGDTRIDGVLQLEVGTQNVVGGYTNDSASFDTTDSRWNAYWGFQGGHGSLSNSFCSGIGWQVFVDSTNNASCTAQGASSGQSSSENDNALWAGDRSGFGCQRCTDSVFLGDDNCSNTNAPECIGLGARAFRDMVGWTNVYLIGTQMNTNSGPTNAAAIFNDRKNFTVLGPDAQRTYIPNTLYIKGLGRVETDATQGDEIVSYRVLTNSQTSSKAEFLVLESDSFQQDFTAAAEWEIVTNMNIQIERGLVSMTDSNITTLVSGLNWETLLTCSFQKDGVPVISANFHIFTNGVDTSIGFTRSISAQSSQGSAAGSGTLLGVPSNTVIDLRMDVDGDDTYEFTHLHFQLKEDK